MRAANPNSDGDVPHFFGRKNVGRPPNERKNVGRPLNGRRTSFLIWIIITIIFAGLFLRYLDRAPKRHYSDFRVYYETGKRFIAKENIYARPDESITPFKYSPLFAMLVSPLSFFPKRIASLIFFTISFISLAAVFIFSKKLIVQTELLSREVFLLYFFSAIFSFRFILHALDSGQATLITLLLIVSGLYFLREERALIAASLIGLSIMFKYTPILFLPYLILRKKIGAAFLILLLILIYCLAPAIYVGLEKEIIYVKSWYSSFFAGDSFNNGSWYDNKNQSLFSFLVRYFTADSPYRFSLKVLTFNQGIFGSLIAGVIIFLFITFPKKDFSFREPLDYSLLFLSMTLFNPNAWLHNFVALIFVYMTLFYYLIATNFKDRLTLALICVSFALTTFTSELFIGETVENFFYDISAITAGTLILVFIIFKLKLQRRH